MWDKVENKEKNKESFYNLITWATFSFSHSLGVTDSRDSGIEIASFVPLYF